MQLGSAAARGEINLLINSGELRRAIGGSPGLEHWTPSCCEAMEDVQADGDILLLERDSRSRNDDPLSLAEDDDLTYGRTRHLRSHLLELRQ